MEHLELQMPTITNIAYMCKLVATFYFTLITDSTFIYQYSFQQSNETNRILHIQDLG